MGLQAGSESYTATLTMFSWPLFNSNSALAEVCALLSALLFFRLRRFSLFSNYRTQRRRHIEGYLLREHGDVVNNRH